MCVFLRESSSMLQSQLVACQSGHFVVFVSHFRKVALYCSWNYALNSPIDVFASFRLSSAFKKKKTKLQTLLVWNNYFIMVIDSVS